MAFQQIQKIGFGLLIVTQVRFMVNIKTNAFWKNRDWRVQVK